MSGYFVSLLMSTFVLEDVALASAIALVSNGKMSFFLAFLACFLGIAIGDLGLYWFGYLASKFKIFNDLSFLKRYQQALERLKSSPVLTYSIVVSRAIPGTRLPTYVGAGYLNYSFFLFFFLTLASVFFWVAFAMLFGKSLSSLFNGHWIPAILSFLIGLQILKAILPSLLNDWDRKAFLQSWRKWTHFEFWPAWFFYLPVVPYYVYLSLKHRSFLNPFYASPGLAHGGLIGESKWDFLKHLPTSDSTTLKSIKLGSEMDLAQIRVASKTAEIHYPFVIKPDVGQRGFGVRIIRGDEDLTQYLALSDFDKIIQRLSILPKEAGLFYVRKPSEKYGRIFSITDKVFPSVTGDGATCLGDLILRDARAKIIASVYFQRHAAFLGTVPLSGEKFVLADCGNHCQGAIFLNGGAMITEELTTKLDLIAKRIPDFYFGRFDVRYRDQPSLMRGEHFEIVEVNGSGSEATHIWDPNTNLSDAYKTLYSQWALLFEIGSEVKKTPGKQTSVDIVAFLKECARVAFRKNPLSVSS